MRERVLRRLKTKQVTEEFSYSTRYHEVERTQEAENTAEGNGI